jgi:hypothetical protein
MTLTRTPETIAAEITAWDCRDVRVLRDLLAELRACRDENGDAIDPRAYGVDTADLPSAPIPEWVDTSYPVWAVDVNGYALVGSGLDEVLHIECLPSEMEPAGWAVIRSSDAHLFHVGETRLDALSGACDCLGDELDPGLDDGSLELVPVTRAVLRRWNTNPDADFDVYLIRGVYQTERQFENR